MATPLPLVVEPRLDPAADGFAAALQSQLERVGYAVVAGALSQESVADLERLFWDFVEEASAQPWMSELDPDDALGWRRDDPASWTDDRLRRMGGLAPDVGIINRRGAGQSDASWLARLQCAHVFAKIWGTEELVTSYDGVGLFRPWQGAATNYDPTRGGWLHVDQGKECPGRQCVQGLVSVYDQTSATGGLCVVPGSHLLHDAVCSSAPDGGDYVELPPGHGLDLAQAHFVPSRAGDLVLWDSRTLHCNTPAWAAPGPDLRLDLARAQSRLLRAVVYVCMTPRAWASDATLADRRQGYGIHMTTSHWPHRNAMGMGWSRSPRQLAYETAGQRQRLI